MSIYPSGKTDKDIEAVYQQAHLETLITYPKKSRWFSPRLKNLNHVHHEEGRVIKGILALLAKLLLEFWEWGKAELKKSIRKIYPRRDKIIGTKKDAYLCGKLTFSKKADSATPIHNIQVEMWAQKRLGGWRKFSEGYTDEDGNFRLEYDYVKAMRNRYRKFHFEIYQTTHVFFNQDSSEPVTKYEIFERIKINKSDLTGMGYNLGTIQLFYWEYRTDTILPRVVIRDHDKDAPEYYSVGRNKAIEQQFVPIELTKDLHLALIKLDPDSLNIMQIQDDYPVNLTVRMEEILKGSTRCDYWFGRRMMNGMNCATFLPDKKMEGHFWVKYFGACNYDVNDEYAFPTTKTLFKIAENGLPLPVKIILQGPINAFNKDPYQTHEITPEDGEKWEHAKRVVRVSGSLSTELDDHFAGTHLNTEQYSVAARRNLRKNPVAELLFPHLKEVVLINHSADTILIGPGYIPKASALSANGIKQRVEDIMGILDWKNWKPMEQISESHTYAKAENMFWDITGEFVEYFFNLNESKIIEEWYEIYCFSNDLVNHSLPLFHTAIKHENPSEKQVNMERIEYYHERYRLDISLDRKTINGLEKCVSTITSNKYKPEPGDLENLKSACKYAIMMATFMHAHVNEHQNEDIGEIRYSSLGLRFSDSEDGILQPEEEYSIAPDLTRATQMMWVSNLLSRTEFGFITRNEENDISPYFGKLLEDKRKEFAKLDVDVDNIESRTNI
jgi:hypothetical protein